MNKLSCSMSMYRSGVYLKMTLVNIVLNKKYSPNRTTHVVSISTGSLINEKSVPNATQNVKVQSIYNETINLQSDLITVAF